MLQHFTAVSHHEWHIQTLKSFYPMENQPCLFTSRAELYLTIIRHRTGCPVSPLQLQFGLEVRPEHDAHTPSPHFNPR